jgi:peroxiredoxin
MGYAQHRMVQKGSRAPDFKLKDLAGSEVSLHELLPNGPVLLAFFKVTCPVCQLTFPFLDRIHRERTAASIAIYGISQDDERWTRDFNERHGVTFPTLLDPADDEYPASNAYGISTVPTLLLVERDGTISWTLEGFSKRELQALGAKAGVNPFRADDYVPEWKAG